MSEQKPLNSLIEKIIESGNLSRDDQAEINRIAMSSSVSEDDSRAVEKLTSMISEGRVHVVN